MRKSDFNGLIQTMYHSLKPILVPLEYDYIGAYLTDRCHLRCEYCITRHHGAQYGRSQVQSMEPHEWIRGLNRLELPADVPITLQGGEPFLYKGIWDILENVRHKMDILTALPPFLTRRDFLRLRTLEWNRRVAPYPRIRVSFHPGQNHYEDLIRRIADLQDIVSIGMYYLDEPATGPEKIAAIRAVASQYGVEVRRKEFLGRWGQQVYGTYLYPEAVSGIRQSVPVWCRNTVIPIAPDGKVYRCHSDLYFQRKTLALGHLLDVQFAFPGHHLVCDNFGLCSECDVKIKTNRFQQYGYTSVDIRRMESAISWTSRLSDSQRSGIGEETEA
jgi:hypothetical protein